MPIDTLFTIAILVFSVILHEISHGYMAEALGDPTARLSGRLTLNPLPHLDLWGSFIIPLILIITNAGFVIGWAKPVPYNPHNLRNKKWGEALVAGAGPAMNIFIALIFSIAVRFWPLDMMLKSKLAVAALSPQIPLAEIATTPIEFAFGGMIVIVMLNLLLAFFNLVPIPPLDGSKILASFIPLHVMHRFSFQAFSARLGFMGGFLLILLFLFFLWPVLFKFVAFLFAFFTGIPLAN